MKRAAEKPVSELLSLAAHYTSVAVDLALYTLASRDQLAAREVLRLERAIDDYLSDIIAGTALAIRAPSQTGLAIGIVVLAEAFDKISDAAGDLAGLVLRGLPVHKFVSASSVCCGEVVTLVRVNRKPLEMPSLVDLLLLRRDGEYRISPEWSDVREGDIVVIRGPLEEAEEFSRAVGYSIYSQLSRGTPALISAIAGDDLSNAVLQIKSLARLMLDLALHSLLYNDKALAREVLRLEDEADSLYIKGLEAAFAAGNPAASEEMVSIAVFIKSMESIADAATMIANITIEGLVSDFLVETMEEAEEAYLKLLVGEELEGKTINELGLEDDGFLPVAVRSGSTLILPVPRDYKVKAGDLIIVKYYQPEGGDPTEALEAKGYKVIPPGSPEG
ncbi:MAG: hypothetical protein GSR80_001773 [Desulfurococcales archaeon]|nr:hypothetical protein [Desulfurococcales archaeon]